MTDIRVNPGETPQTLANELRPGDSLIFAPGLHYGCIDIPVDDVDIVGEEGAILDGTLPFDDDWQLATDNDGHASLAGTGTWRTRAPWVWMLLDKDANVVFRIDSDYVGNKEPNNFYMSAYEAMAVANGARPPIDYGYDWWNGIEAFSAYNKSNGHIYCRYRDGKKPDRMRWSGGYTDHRQPPYPEGSVIYLGDRNNINISGLTIRGCVVDIAVVDSQNVFIDECKLRSYDFGVRVQGNCNNIKVWHSDFNCKLYGTTIHTPRSKSCDWVPYPPDREIAWRQYTTGKFFHDESDSTHLSGMSIYNGVGSAPKNIEFAYNYVTCGQFGVDCFGGDGIDIHHNRIHNMIDMPFQRTGDGGKNIKVHDNETWEAGYTLMRWHLSNQEAGDNYIYNNRVSNLDGVGDYIFHGGTYDGQVRDSNLRVWHYHNTYAGGHTVFLISGLNAFPGFIAINNLINGDAADIDKENAQIGAFENNWQGNIWPTDQIEHEFKVPDGHECKGAAIDVSKIFVLNGRSYNALPGFESGYAKDIGWNDPGDTDEIPNPPTNGDTLLTISVTPTQINPGGEVTVSWSGSTSPADWIGLYELGGDNEDPIAWAYTNGEQEASVVVASGSMEFNVPGQEGTYELRIFKNDSWTPEAHSEQVIVSGEEVPEPPPEENDKILGFIPVWIYPDGTMEPITGPEGAPQVFKAEQATKAMSASLAGEPTTMSSSTKSPHKQPKKGDNKKKNGGKKGGKKRK